MKVLEIKFKLVIKTRNQSPKITKIVHRFTKPTSNEISDGVLGLEKRFSVQRCRWAYKREMVAHKFSHGELERSKLQDIWQSLHIDSYDFLNILVRRFHLFHSEWVTIGVPVSRISAFPQFDIYRPGLDEVE